MTNTPQTRTIMSAVEKIGLALALLTAIILIGFSFFSIIVDTIFKFDLYGIVLDLIFLGIGIFLGYFSVRMYKKSAYYESLVNSAFDEGIYTRLEPVLRKVAETSVEMEDVESRLNKIDHMVQTVLEEQVKMEKSPHAEVEKAIAPGTSMGFAMKTILLAIITMSGFFLMIEVNLMGIHYITLIFYVLWWALITGEFELFNNTVAWLTLFAAILLVPFTFMMFHTLFTAILEIGVGENVTICIYYAFLWIYAFLYFSWAVYETKGTLPFSFRIRHK